MTKEELENYQEKVRNGEFLYLRVRAADELMTTITKLRFSKEKYIKGLLQNNIKNLIFQNTAHCDDIYFTDNRFAKDVLAEINIDGITNEMLGNILELVKAKKAELEKEFEEYKI